MIQPYLYLYARGIAECIIASMLMQTVIDWLNDDGARAVHRAIRVQS